MAVDDGNDYYRSTGIRFFDFFALFVTFFFLYTGQWNASAYTEFTMSTRT